MATAKKKPATRHELIDAEYISTLDAAAKTHASAEKCSERLILALALLGSGNVRRPNDWCFHFNRQVELRWYDSDEYGGSTVCVSLFISGEQGTDEFVSISGRTEKSYDDRGRINVSRLRLDPAVRMLDVLLTIVDKVA